MLKHLLLRCSDFYMPLLALIIYLLQQKKIGSHKRFLFFYLLCSTVVYGITDIMSYHYINNLFLYHLIHWAELVSVSYYILRVISGRPYAVFYWVAGAYTVFELVNLFLWEPLTTFNSNGAAVGSLTILIISMYYMLRLSKSDDILNFQHLPAFWFVSAFLVSCALGTLVLAAYKLYVIMGWKEQRSIWMIMNVTYILKFAFIIVGLLCYNRPPHRSSSRHPSLL